MGDGSDELGIRLVVEGLDAFDQGIETAQDRVDKLRARFDALEDQTADTGATGESSFNIMDAAAGFVLSKVTLIIDKLFELGRASIEAAAQFQDEMAVVAVKTGASADEMARLHDLALAWGSTGRVTAQEAAVAMAGLAERGLDATEIYAALPGVIDLATASNQNMGESADDLIGIMARFDRPFADSQAVVDALVQSAHASGMTVDEMLKALDRAGDVAAPLGITLEQTALMLALLGEHSLAGTEAGAALAAMLTQLTSDSEKANAVLEDIGVTLYDEEGNFRNMSQVVAEMADAFDKMPDKQRADAIKDLAGSVGGRALTSLVEEGAQGWDQMATNINESATASDLAAAKLDTVHGKIEAIGTKWDTLLVKVGEPLLGPIGDILDALIEVLDFLEGAADAIGDMFTVTLPNAINLAKSNIEKTWNNFWKWEEGGAIYDAVMGLRAGWDAFWGDGGPIQTAIDNALAGIGGFFGEIERLWHEFLVTIGVEGPSSGAAAQVSDIIAKMERGETLSPAEQRQWEDFVAGRTHRARGGAAWQGLPYMVGEAGPELFVPRTTGMVLPTPATAAALGGGAGAAQGGRSINFYGDVLDPDGITLRLRQAGVMHGF